MRRRAARIYVLAGKSGRAVYPTSNLQTPTRRGTTNGKILLNGEIGGRFLACARNDGGTDCGEAVRGLQRVVASWWVSVKL